MSAASQGPHSRFATVVPTVRRFPVWIVIFGWFLVVVNTFFGITFLISPDGVIPGLGATGADQQAALMLSGRNLGQALILAFALLYKNVRVLQVVWLMAIIREVSDLYAVIVRNNGDLFGPGPVIVIVILIVEIAAFIYLGMIASGRVSRYVQSER